MTTQERIDCIIDKARRLKALEDLIFEKLMDEQLRQSRESWLSE